MVMSCGYPWRLSNFSDSMGAYTERGVNTDLTSRPCVRLWYNYWYLVLAPSNDIAHFVIRPLDKKFLFFHWKLGACYRVGCVGLRLLKPAFSPPIFLVVIRHTGHIPSFSTSKGICLSRKNFLTVSAVSVS